jgi:ribosomal protein S18 acetylase RimI-like enzyme
MSDITITEVTAISPELVTAMARLVAQLSASTPAPTEALLAKIVASPASRLLIATDPAVGVVGTLTLALFATPTGVRGLIEDVVVDTSARGRGAGEALTRAALDLARTAGARTVDLTSRPSREAANRLYQRVGFVRRETNAYRYTL